MKPELSVIIPTRNRADDLSRALASISRQTLVAEAFEVVVVDNGSTDGTHAVVERAAGSLRSLRYVFDATPGLHVGRHRGMAAATADVLVYTDDDVEALPGWLAALREVFRDPTIALAGGRNLPAFDGQPPPWLDRMWDRQPSGRRMLGYVSILDLGATERVVNPHLVWGCNYAIRRQALLAAGGFHPDGMPPELAMRRGDGESWVSECVRATGLKAWYDPRASVRHRVPASRMSMDFLRSRAYTQGVSDSYTILRERARRQGRILPAPPVADRRAARLRVLYGLKRAAGWLPAAGVVARVVRQVHRSGVRGYDDHRRQVARDAELLQWVTKSSYLT